jgi:hypothetical protein
MGGEPPRLTLAEVTEQLAAVSDYFDEQGYLQKAFGYHCVDGGPVAGDFGIGLQTHFYLETGLRMQGSIRQFLVSTDEVGFLTAVEFIHHHVAKPNENTGHFHSYNGCGWHFDCKAARFDVATARTEWRNKVNQALKFYGDGYELSSHGEVERVAPGGMVELVEASAPAKTGDTNIAKLNSAIRTFRWGLSTREQRKQAVRELADLLEFYRAEVKAYLSRDEGDLFNIANNFAIRHHTQLQKDDYDDAWLSWMFYFYLSTVRLLLDRVHGPAETDEVPGPEAMPPDEDDPDDIPF